MKLNNFASLHELENTLAKEIGVALNNSIEKKGYANLLLSGGSTPINLYRKLSDLDLEWNKITVGLVDERFVPTDSEHSNEKMIIENLLINKAAKTKLVGMVYYANDLFKNIEKVNELYDEHFSSVDFCILGMGPDGHTASLFPGDEKSKDSLTKKNQTNIISTVAPSHPQRRITCGYSFLRKSNKIALMIKGDGKISLLTNKEREKLPIDYFTDNLEVFCT